MVYSGELEPCKDICRSEMRLIDREVCEDRKNLHSACQWVELSVLHLTTSICRTNTTGLCFRERKKKQEESSYDNWGKSGVLWFCSKVLHVCTYCTQAPVWLVAAAGEPAVCSRALQNRACSAFSSGILQAHA